MRIKETYFVHRLTHLENEPTELRIRIVGFKEDLEKLLKTVAYECVVSPEKVSEETRQKT